MGNGYDQYSISDRRSGAAENTSSTTRTLFHSSVAVICNLKNLSTYQHSYRLDLFRDLDVRMNFLCGLWWCTTESRCVR
jgi:hypothetical protein